MALLQVSLAAGNVDGMFWFWMGVSGVFLLAITAAMAAFVVRYRHGRPQPKPPLENHVALEVVWTLVPTALFLTIFYVGWTDYRTMRNPPRDALAVGVTARQWNWTFRYPNGKETGKLFAPVNRPVRLDVRSVDVVHGFFVPAMRLKVDAVPGHRATAWFQAVRQGLYDIQCTVICGVDHSRMNSEVVVVPEAEFRRWYFGPEDAPEPGAGEPPGLQVLRFRGCLGCHSLDGAPAAGPTFKGLLGRREQLQDGRWITVDEARVRKAILGRGHQPARGYPPMMPAEAVGPAELDQIAAYLGTLR